MSKPIEPSAALAGSETESLWPFIGLTDEEVLAAADQQISADDDSRLSELLSCQQGLLTSSDRAGIVLSDAGVSRKGCAKGAGFG